MDEQNSSNETTQTTKCSSESSRRKLALITTAIRGWRKVYPTYGEALDREQIKFYFQTLEDLDEAVLAKALIEVGKTCKVFPLPAHIREAAKGEPGRMDFSYMHDMSRYYQGVPAKKEIA